MAAECDLGVPEFVVPGYLARSQVGVNADSVIKLYLIKAEAKQAKEAAALRAFADTGVVPGILHRTRSFQPELPTPECCRVVWCHGDFSGRNVMAAEPARGGGLEIAGIIDFEKSGPECFATDLLTYRLKTLMGLDTDWAAFVGGYDGDDPVDSGRAHLAYHLHDHVTWAMRWALELDPPYARRVLAAASTLLSG